MSDKVTTLHVVKPPTADDEAKATAIAMIEELLAEAKRGEIVEFAMVIMRPSDDDEIWDERATPTRKKSLWIGKLMILMVNWIRHMDDDDDDRETSNE